MKTGFKCECGKAHEYTAYVYAHKNEKLHHRCEACGRIHIILHGEAKLSRKKRLK